MILIPLLEIIMKPKIKDKYITYIIIRLEDISTDEAIPFLEEEFSKYEIEHIIEGYKKQ
jgi:hypothetical protein